MKEFMLYNPFYHFLRRYFIGVGSHPPTVQSLYFFSLLYCQNLQQSSGNHGQVNESLHCIYSISDQLFDFWGHVFYIFRLQALIITKELPCFCPEMVRKTAKNMFDHFKGNLNLESLGIEAYNFCRRHRQIRTHQNKSLLTILNKNKTQCVLQWFPPKVQTKHRNSFRFTIDLCGNGFKLVSVGVKKFFQFKSFAIFWWPAFTTIGRWI